MREFRTFDQAQEEYYRDHPDEIDEFLAIAFEEHAKDKDTGALLSALRTVSRIKGVSLTAETAGMTRKGLQKALSKDAKPRFESVNAILEAMGYRLMPQKIGGETIRL